MKRRPLVRRVLAVCAFVVSYVVAVTVLTDLSLQERALYGLVAVAGFFGMMAIEMHVRGRLGTLRRAFPDRQPTWVEICVAGLFLVDASLRLVTGTASMWPAVAAGFAGTLVVLGVMGSTDLEDRLRRRSPDVGVLMAGVAVLAVVYFIIIVQTELAIPTVPRAWVESPLTGGQYAFAVYIVTSARLTGGVDGWVPSRTPERSQSR